MATEELASLPLFSGDMNADELNEAMILAAQRGQLETMKFLIERGADDWNRGMAWAARGGHMETVKFLVERGADDLNWAMGWAAQGGHLETVKFLVERGADDWNRAMIMAALNGHLEIIKFLVECGADDWTSVYDIAKFVAVLESHELPAFLDMSNVPDKVKKLIRKRMEREAAVRVRVGAELYEAIPQIPRDLCVYIAEYT